jgi:hypothetical protein
MYRKRNNGQISIEEFHLPFGGTLDPDNRWVQLEKLMPWEQIKEVYASQFATTLGAPPGFRKDVTPLVSTPGGLRT